MLVIYGGGGGGFMTWDGEGEGRVDILEGVSQPYVTSGC